MSIKSWLCNFGPAEGRFTLGETAKDSVLWI